MDRTSLAGEVAIVTGAGRNNGRAIAIALAEAGAAVAVGVRANVAEANSVVNHIVANGGSAIPVIADVSRPENAQAIVNTVTERFGGPPTILVNNVGIRLRREFLSISWAEWDFVLRTNLSSMFYLAQAVLPGMLKRGWGRIINLSGGDAYHGSVNRVHVTASKGGVIGFTRALAIELAATTQGRVTVNAVVPGYIDTTLPDGSRRGHIDLPMGRRGTTEEVAAACLFLASKEASYVTGQALQVNGGLVMT